MTVPVRVLCCNGGAMDFGGITTVLLNYLKHLDRGKVAVDLLVHGEQIGPRENEAVALGAKVIHVPYRRRSLLSYNRIVKNACRGYDIVHAHMDGGNALMLRLAKKAGVPCRIAHCHNTAFLTTNPVKLFFLRKSADRIPRVATHLAACSDAAAEFLFHRTKDVRIVRNALLLEERTFDASARERVREALRLDGKCVILQAGRFDYQKNQAFMLSVFERLAKRRDDCVLVFAGDGAARVDLERRAADAGLRERVRFTGFYDDMRALYAAADCFVLPSRFEGLGIVLVEAQCAGLPCFASDVVPRETNVTGCTYLPIDDPAQWADALAGFTPPGDREVSKEAFVRAGYDIVSEAEKVQNWYLEMAKR